MASSICIKKCARHSHIHTVNGLLRFQWLARRHGRNESHVIACLTYSDAAFLLSPRVIEANGEDNIFTGFCVCLSVCVRARVQRNCLRQLGNYECKLAKLNPNKAINNFFCTDCTAVINVIELDHGSADTGVRSNLVRIMKTRQESIWRRRYSWTAGYDISLLFYDVNSELKNKKAVLLQRWPRDARYVSRSWAVAEIWPFAYVGGIWNPHFVEKGRS